MNDNAIAHDFAWVAAFDVVHRLRPHLGEDAQDAFAIVFPVMKWAVEEALKAAAAELPTNEKAVAGERSSGS